VDKYTIWSDPTCYACEKTDAKFKSKKYDYEIRDLNNQTNEKILTNIYPQYKKDKSTPVIQKCTIEHGKITNCTFTVGFRESDYE